MSGSLVGQTEANIKAAFNIMNAMSGGKVLMVASCNGIDGIPGSVQRRFNLGTFFFDLPTAAEREVILRMYLTKYEINPDQPMPGMNNWTGAEIANLCKRSFELRMSLVEAAGFSVPIAIADGDGVKQLRQRAHNKYISAAVAGPYRFDERPAGELGDGARTIDLI